MGKSINTKKYISMYKAGLSTFQIAKKFGVTRQNVRSVLVYWGIKMRHLGDDIEIKVKEWLEKEGCKVTHQKGNAPFDLLVDGIKIDVKSAHKHYDKNNKSSDYFFQLQDRFNRLKSKNLQEAVDFYYLVFLDEKLSPVYRLSSSEILATQTLRIPSTFNSKYPLQFMGNLGEGV